MQNISLLKQASEEQIASKFNCQTSDLIKIARSKGLLETLIKRYVLEEEWKKIGIDNNPNLQRDWRESRWGSRVEEYFLAQKATLDVVSFWSCTLNNKYQAMEIYYQLCNNEITHNELSKTIKSYKKQESMPVGHFNKTMQRLFKISTANVPLLPQATPKGYFILTVTSLKSAKLTNEIREKFLIQLEDEWCTREVERRLDS